MVGFEAGEMITMPEGVAGRPNPAPARLAF
jgi:hypothetical protein